MGNYQAVITSLGVFGTQEREAKLTKLGDALQVLGRHGDFTAMAASVDKATPRPSREDDV
ncbi:MAG: hypothetical protein K2X55_18525 [Burkholderiaceae bacterium]|nr:hypothetical protein [Burkholderiaceae bacterium]